MWVKLILRNKLLIKNQATKPQHRQVTNKSAGIIQILVNQMKIITIIKCSIRTFCSSNQIIETRLVEKNHSIPKLCILRTTTVDKSTNNEEPNMDVAKKL